MPALLRAVVRPISQDHEAKGFLVVPQLLIAEVACDQAIGSWVRRACAFVCVAAFPSSVPRVLCAVCACLRLV